MHQELAQLRHAILLLGLIPVFVWHGDHSEFGWQYYLILRLANSSQANVLIREDLQIENGATAGIGAVVIKDVEPGAIVAGNPAKSTVKITKVNRAIARLVVEENGR